MEKIKNIYLFRGENTQKIGITMRAWREKFIEKHGEMNLVEIHNSTMSDNSLTDCLSTGFGASTRMFIFWGKLLKSEKEQEKIQENQKHEEPSLEDDGKRTSKVDDTEWIKTLQKVPTTNFIMFIGNKKPVSELEKWLEKESMVQDFGLSTFDENISFIQQSLNMPRHIAEYMAGRLNNDIRFIDSEVKKLQGAKKTQWDHSDIDNNIPDYREENVFQLLDFLWRKDYKSVINIWNNLMATADHELTTATIITLIRKILIAATYADLRDLPISPFQLSLGRKMSNKKQSLSTLYNSIIEVDQAEKSGNLPDKTQAFLMSLLSYS